MTVTDWAIIGSSLFSAIVIDLREYVRWCEGLTPKPAFDFQAALPRWLLGLATGVFIVLTSYAGH